MNDQRVIRYSQLSFDPILYKQEIAKQLFPFVEVPKQSAHSNRQVLPDIEESGSSALKQLIKQDLVKVTTFQQISALTQEFQEFITQSQKLCDSKELRTQIIQLQNMTEVGEKAIEQFQRCGALLREMALKTQDLSSQNQVGVLMDGLKLNKIEPM